MASSSSSSLPRRRRRRRRRPPPPSSRLLLLSALWASSSVGPSAAAAEPPASIVGAGAGAGGASEAGGSGGGGKGEGDEDPDPCRLYLAESTIPNAGVGMFAGIPYLAGRILNHDSYGDTAILTFEQDWHSSPARGPSISRHDHGYHWPLTNYDWNSPAVGMDDEGEDCSVTSPGFGGETDDDDFRTVSEAMGDGLGWKSRREINSSKTYQRSTEDDLQGKCSDGVRPALGPLAS
ncbi:hypothetical protein ACHAWF_003623 [Thalassiosira exigua]